MEEKNNMQTRENPIMYRFGKWAGDWIGENPIKLSYPLLGALSNKIQEKLENIPGYNIGSARNVSHTTNLIGYTLLSGCAGLYLLANDSALDYFTAFTFFAFPGLIMGRALESTRRVKSSTAYFEEQRFKGSNGSKQPINRSGLIGKLASIPLELAFGVYDGIKQTQNTRRK